MFYSDDNFDDIFEIENQIQTKEIDPKVLAKKEIGDIVTIIDYSAVTSEYGIEIEDNAIEFDDEFIVIETNLNNKFKTKHVTYIQDIIVINRRTKLKYRTPSYYTKLVK